MNKEIVLLFSGGIDSMYAAIKLAEEYDKVRLISFDNEYGHFRTDRVKKRVKELSVLYPGKFSLKTESIKKSFEKIVIDQLLKDMKKYSSAFNWCMGCKLAMQAHAIRYAKKNNIRDISDGASSETSEMIEQSKEALKHIKRKYKQHKLKYTNNYYNITRDEKRNFLKKKGTKLGIQIFDRHIGIQPKCIPGELYYSPYILLGIKPKHKVEELKAFLSDKDIVIERLIGK